jgi:hypothetical protein
MPKKEIPRPCLKCGLQKMKPGKVQNAAGRWFYGWVCPDPKCGNKEIKVDKEGIPIPYDKLVPKSSLKKEAMQLFKDESGWNIYGGPHMEYLAKGYTIGEIAEYLLEQGEGNPNIDKMVAEILYEARNGEPVTLDNFRKRMEGEMPDLPSLPKAAATSPNAIVELDGEFSMGLMEIIKGMKLFDPKDEGEYPWDVFDANIERTEEWVKQEVQKEVSAEVEVKKVSFEEADSGNASHASVYYSVTLQGPLSILKEVTGEDKAVYVDWEEEGPELTEVTREGVPPGYPRMGPEASLKKGTVMERTAGLEKHIDEIIENINPDLRSVYQWNNGMEIVESPLEETAFDLMDILDTSGEFGPTRFNPETQKIEFGPMEQYWTPDKQFKTYDEFVQAFKDFKVEASKMDRKALITHDPSRSFSPNQRVNVDEMDVQGVVEGIDPTTGMIKVRTPYGTKSYKGTDLSMIGAKTSVADADRPPIGEMGKVFEEGEEGDFSYPDPEVGDTITFGPEGKVREGSILDLTWEGNLAVIACKGENGPRSIPITDIRTVRKAVDATPFLEGNKPEQYTTLGEKPGKGEYSETLPEKLDEIAKAQGVGGGWKEKTKPGYDAPPNEPKEKKSSFLRRSAEGTPITEDLFWELVGVAASNPSEYEERLGQFSKNQLKQLEKIYYSKLDRIGNARITKVLNDNDFVNDSEDYAREGIIAKGRDFYESVLKDPENAADAEPMEGFFDYPLEGVLEKGEPGYVAPPPPKAPVEERAQKYIALFSKDEANKLFFDITKDPDDPEESGSFYGKLWNKVEDVFYGMEKEGIVEKFDWDFGSGASYVHMSVWVEGDPTKFINELKKRLPEIYKYFRPAGAFASKKSSFLRRVVRRREQLIDRASKFLVLASEADVKGDTELAALLDRHANYLQRKLAGQVVVRETWFDSPQDATQFHKEKGGGGGGGAMGPGAGVAGPLGQGPEEVKPVEPVVEEKTTTTKKYPVGTNPGEVGGEPLESKEEVKMKSPSEEASEISKSKKLMSLKKEAGVVLVVKAKGNLSTFDVGDKIESAYGEELAPVGVSIQGANTYKVSFGTDDLAGIKKAVQKAGFTFVSGDVLKEKDFYKSMFSSLKKEAGTWDLPDTLEKATTLKNFIETLASDNKTYQGNEALSMEQEYSKILLTTGLGDDSLMDALSGVGYLEGVDSTDDDLDEELRDIRSNYRFTPSKWIGPIIRHLDEIVCTGQGSGGEVAPRGKKRELQKAYDNWGSDEVGTGRRGQEPDDPDDLTFIDDGAYNILLSLVNKEYRTSGRKGESAGGSFLHRTAVAPPGWEGTVKEMKDKPEIDNPWALSHWMANRGYQPGGKKKKKSALGAEEEVLTIIDPDGKEVEIDTAIAALEKGAPCPYLKKKKKKADGGGFYDQGVVPGICVQCGMESPLNASKVCKECFDKSPSGQTGEEWVQASKKTAAGECSICGEAPATKSIGHWYICNSPECAEAAKAYLEEDGIGYPFNQEADIENPVVGSTKTAGCLPNVEDLFMK